MHIVLGATGHVGSALTRALLQRGEPVTIVVRNPDKAVALRDRGAQLATADLHDADALRAIFARGQRLFVLNPPAAPSTDTDVEERATLRSILSAVAGSGLEKIVAESTYGAQPGTRIGDAGVLYELEQALLAQPIPTSIIRGAYYMSNWDAGLQSARRDGKLESFYPPDFVLPMVAPQDLGAFAARLITGLTTNAGLHHVEGPERHTPRDVAATLADLLHRPVEAVEIPRDRWQAALAGMGFSPQAAESFAGMSEAALRGGFPARERAVHGATTLRAYLEAQLASP